VFIIVPAVGGLVAGYSWKFLFSHAAATATPTTATK
jgi:hypothetical protein